jgi:hypothetical protein
MAKCRQVSTDKLRNSLSILKTAKSESEEEYNRKAKLIKRFSSFKKPFEMNDEEAATIYSSTRPKSSFI